VVVVVVVVVMAREEEAVTLLPIRKSWEIFWKPSMQLQRELVGGGEDDSKIKGGAL